jgi:uncharacterized protein (DUF3820 family)
LEIRILFEEKHLLQIASLKMPFGKYKNVVLIDLPEDYLLWFSRKEFPQGNLGMLMQLTLEIKINGLEGIIEPLKKSSSDRK